MKLKAFLQYWYSLIFNKMAWALLLSLMESLHHPQHVSVTQNRWHVTKGVFDHTLLMPYKIFYFSNYHPKPCHWHFSSYQESSPFTFFSPPSFWVSKFLSPLSTKEKIQNAIYFNMQSYLQVTKHPNQINLSKKWNRLHHMTNKFQDRAGFKQNWGQRFKQWLGQALLLHSLALVPLCWFHI